MEKKLIVLFILAFGVFTACKKTEDNSPAATTTQNTACLQQSFTNYDVQGVVTSQSLYYYTDGRLDSIVSVSGNTRNVTLYTYSSNLSRKVSFKNNGVVSNIHSIQTLNEKGLIIKNISYNNNAEVGKQEYSYNCN